MRYGLGYDENGNAPDLLCSEDMSKIQNGQTYRASGEVSCPRCGFKYREHPPVQGALWLNRICSGDLVKL